MTYAISFSGVAVIEANNNDEALGKFAKMKKCELVKHLWIRHCEDMPDEMPDEIPLGE